MTLVEFLRARLDEDERVALATVDVNVRADMKRGGAPPGWVADGSQVRDGGRHEVLRVRHSWAAEVEHIARHDPVRVLAEVEAKRRIVETVLAMIDADRESAGRGERSVTRRRILRLLALPHADHPDYDPAWRPE